MAAMIQSFLDDITSAVLSVSERIHLFVAQALKDSSFIDGDLLQLYLNPLYLFPIVGVIATGILVYAFGFKSTSTPPTLHLFASKASKKSNTAASTKSREKRKDAKKNAKLTKALGAANSAPSADAVNGNATLVSNQVAGATKKANPSSPAKSKPANQNQKTSNKPATTPTTAAGGRGKGKDKKSLATSPDEGGDGGWVEITSKKNRRNKKEDEPKAAAPVKASVDSVGKSKANSGKATPANSGKATPANSGKATTANSGKATTANSGKATTTNSSSKKKA